jgi:hypothetical protein
MSLAEENSKNVFYYLRNKNTNIFDGSIRAAVSFIEAFPNRLDFVIEDLIEFYNSEMKIIEELNIKASVAN